MFTTEGVPLGTLADQGIDAVPIAPSNEQDRWVGNAR